MIKTLVSLGFLAACAEEPLISSSLEQDVSKDDLTGQGYKCELTDTPYGGVWWCTKCDADGTCSAYFCKDGSNTCDGFTMSYVASATYEHDLNYWLEGESATLTAPMQKQASATASGGAYIAVPPTAGLGGSARFTFSAPIAGATMYAWARVIVPSTSANAVTLSLDGRSVGWQLPVTPSWTWVRMPNVTWSVPAGTRTLVVTRDEPDVRIDRILLTSSDTFAPSVATFEAETAAIVAPMQTGGSVLTTRYLYAPAGSGPNGVAQLATPVAHVGGYGVWGLVSAASSSTNAFSIDASFGTPTTWNLPVTGTAWAWSKAPLALALSSSSFLEIRPVEAGARLDKLIVTNDPGFTPVVATIANAPN